MIPIIVVISVLVILNHNVILINSSSDFKQHTCRHYTPKYYDIPPTVVLNNNRGHHLNKRDLGPAGPLRIRVFYHKSVDTLKKRDRDRIRKLVRYLELYNKINCIIFLIISSLHNNISNS